MISKQEVMSLSYEEGTKIAVSLVLKNKKVIEFIREDENDYHGVFTDYKYNKRALDAVFAKAKDGPSLLEGLKSIDEYFLYWDLTAKEEEKLNQEFNSIQSISEIEKIVIQEATAYDPSMETDYLKYEFVF